MRKGKYVNILVFILSFGFVPGCFEALIGKSLIQDVLNIECNSKYDLNYEKYKVASFMDRRYFHDTLENFLSDLNMSAKFGIDTLGQSFAGRDIYGVRWGRGDKKVLLWTQMHGDEPTATQAAADFLNYLRLAEEHDSFVKSLEDSVTFLLILCLNPDGAVNFKRRNVQNVDINRDALKLETPEAAILREAFERFNPNWCFNLHDQSPYYHSTQTNEDVHFSFQAPPIDNTSSKTATLLLAERAIGYLLSYSNIEVESKHLAKYPVRYTPDSFGEYFQSKGVPTVLIETGFKLDDPEKQWLRKQHFYLYQALFQGIGFDELEPGMEKLYNNLPECRIADHDVVIENIEIQVKGAFVRKDMGFRTVWWSCTPTLPLRPVSYLATIADPFSLDSRRYFNGGFYKLRFPQEYHVPMDSIQELIDRDIASLVKDGFLHFHVETPPDSCIISESTPLKINEPVNESFRVGHPVNFYLKHESDSKLDILFYNGHLLKLEDIKPSIFNKLIYSNYE